MNRMATSWRIRKQSSHAIDEPRYDPKRSAWKHESASWYSWLRCQQKSCIPLTCVEGNIDACGDWCSNEVRVDAGSFFLHLLPELPLSKTCPWTTQWYSHENFSKVVLPLTRKTPPKGQGKGINLVLGGAARSCAPFPPLKPAGIQNAVDGWNLRVPRKIESTGILWSGNELVTYLID